MLGGRWELLVWEQMKDWDRALLTASLHLLHPFQPSQQAWELRITVPISQIRSLS